jgi:hypothetical protein
MATRRAIADEDEKIKIGLERAFVRDLRSIFNRMQKEYARRYVARGNILDASSYNVDFVQSFRRQYERVEDKFLGRVIGQNQDPLTQESEDFLEEIALFLSVQNLARAEQQAAIVTETNQQQINSATQRAMAIAENPFDRAEVAVIGLGIIKPNFSARTQSISMVETQIAAENTKATEARSFSAGVVEDTKTWVTVGDNKVRQTHRDANGQTVNIREPFTVGNSMLQYPSDTSMGAELKEVINCRCSAVYNLRSR